MLGGNSPFGYSDDRLDLRAYGANSEEVAAMKMRHRFAAAAAVVLAVIVITGWRSNHVARAEGEFPAPTPDGWSWGDDPQ